MKSIKHRLLSLLLTLVTVLSLLPTAAFAASNTGSGLKITTNQAYWSTRLLANGTPYSYRPPLADGKLVYCMDSGLGYHYATPSYLNSFTWTSGTGADADAVLQNALTNSGLSEMDAATVENVKWMMTYLNDCKASNVGQLFMAVQTYVWDHQSYKGEPGGDGDAGGYANADTYDLYLSLIDWLLEQKAQEDAEFQRQIEEFTAQGKSASIVENESAKWAVYAISSNRKNQSFFNYYGPRKLVTQDEPGGGGEEPTPPAGVGKIVLKKTAGGTTTGLAGARFSIYFNGQIVGSDITNAQGEIYVEDAATGLWSFVETSAPDGFCVDPTPKSVYVDVSEGDREYTVAAVNYERPSMKITKRDAMSGKPIAGTVFSVKSVTGSYSTSVTTGTDGSATLSAIPAGAYVVREESVPEPYIVTNTEQTVALRPGKTSEVTFVDYEKPGLEIIKKNIANGEPIEGVTYRIEQIDGNFSTSATTDNHGRIFLDSVPVGTFKVTEINVPSHVILCPIPQEVALKPGETSTVTFFNALKPTLEIRKVDSVTGDPVKGAKFQIWYGSNHTDTGELNDLGTYFSDESGKIILPEIKDGWYKVTELEAPHGYSIKEPATQECFVAGGESKVLTFENTPLSAIIIRKVDSESGQPLEGAWFRVRYLGGTSGTGGTVIGEYRTSSNGTIVVTGLKAGTYVCEEISAPDGYVITDAAETVYLSGKDQDVITVTFGNDKMGSLLIVKKDSVTGAPISDVEFFITDSGGSVIGTANGRYVTDSAGTIRIDGLTPGMTVIAREVRAKDGYILDDTPQSIKIKRNAVMTLEFRNQPKGGVLVKKVDAVTNAPISDVEFLVTDSDGNLIGNANGKFVTDSAGTFTITDIAPGTTLVIKETRAKAGYILDDTPQTVKVKSNEVTTVEFRNQPKGNLIIVKQDSVTKEPLEGVEFKIVYADGSYVDAAGGTLSSTGLYRTDKEGKITISGISGTVVVTEVQTIPGYTIDENTRTQTVVVNPNDTQTLHFYNTPMHTLIEVTAPDSETLEQRVTEVEKLCVSVDMIARRCDYKNEQAFLSALPILALDPDIERKARRNALTSGVAAAFPFVSYELSDHDGIFLGLNLYNRSPVFLNPYDDYKYTSGNWWIGGSTGAGKTVTLQCLGGRLREQGKRVIIIVPKKGHEFRPLCERLGGLYLRMSPSSKDCPNLMAIRRKSLDSYAKLKNIAARDDSVLADKIAQLIIWFSLKKKDLNEEDKSRLDSSLVEVYKRYGITFDNSTIVDENGNFRTMPILSDWYEILYQEQDTRHLAVVLSRYVTGSAAAMAGRNDIELNNKYIVLDLSGMPDDMIADGTFWATSIAYDLIMNCEDELSALLADELWSLVGATANPQAAGFVLEMVKTIRGLGGIAVTSTQGMQDLFSLEGGSYGKGILDSSRIKLVMQMEEQEARLIQDKLNLSEDEVRQITRFRRGEGLLCIGYNHVPIAFHTTPKEYEAITTSPTDLRIKRTGQIDE